MGLNLKDKKDIYRDISIISAFYIYEKGHTSLRFSWKQKLKEHSKYFWNKF